MQVDYLIVGQGICGTMLSWFLFKEGKSFLVIDNHHKEAASQVAAGLINPVTGRRYTYSWMIDTIMPFAEQSYTAIENYLEEKLLYKKKIIDFFPSPQGRINFLESMAENDSYLSSFPDQNHMNQYFNYAFGCGEIAPAYSVHLNHLITLWRTKLEAIGCLKDQPFDSSQLGILPDGIRYENIHAGKLILCEGAATQNPWFELLPFSFNKGEALTIYSEDLTNEHIYKKGMLLVPLPEKNHYWVGSNYLWDQLDSIPTESFYQSTTTLLRQWIKGKFEVISHKAAIRPATVERRPFVGLHPVHDTIAILNGMGTKGSSLAPFFAHQLVQHLVYGLPLTPEADVKRFSRILSK